MRRHGRRFWTELVAKFEDAGAVEKHEEFAARHGIRCDTFRRWLYLLRAEKRGRRWRPRGRRGTADAPPIAMPLVEVAATQMVDDRFEIDLGDGRRLRVPATFEVEALRRLLAIFDTGRAR